MPERIPARELNGDVVRLTPTSAADAEPLRAIHHTPEVAYWWELPDDDFPLHDEPETTRLTIWHDGRVAGLIQYGEELDEKYHSAWIDIFVAPATHGRGIGTEALRLVVAHLIDNGHHRITIDPAADNAPAVACYTKAGFVPVGVMRLAERDSDGGGWHDALMMEYVVQPRG